MNARVVSLAWTVLCLVALGGCASKATPEQAQAPTETQESKKPFTITMIAKSSNNPVFLAARTGAEAAAKELSGRVGREIKIDWRTPPTEDGQVQAQRIAQAVAAGTDAILISCSDAAKVTGAIDDAVGKGVPVMTFDSDAPASKRFAFYGTDDADAGKRVMDELAAQLGGKGTIAILAGNQNAPNLQKRAQAVRDRAKEYPNIVIVDTFYHVETPQEATKAVLGAMSANPSINGWAMVGGWPLFATTLLTDLDPSRVKIVAVDCLPAQMAYVEKGVAPVLLAQPTYEWGHTSVNLMVDKLLMKKDIAQVNKMELVKVTSANLNDWGKQLQKWGFSDVDPKYLQ
ncbi:MAG TPA: substrate-binding domain-containing protein [Fimbriimonadaceae bacterium]|nr:substrate-binding domain-containing protein [Fimbriimonadaceae bacterium]